jgi:Fe-S cluster biogenesis protein NfuA
MIRSTQILLNRHIRGNGIALAQSRSIFIQTETTPNPQSLKFLPQDKEVLPEKYGTGIHFDSIKTNSLNQNQQHVVYTSPLVTKLFLNTPGIKSVFLGKDFISITKDSEENWAKLKPLIFSQLFDHFASNQPVIVEDSVKKTEGTAVSDTTILDTDDEVVAAIKELIETRVRPSVQEDGGDIFYAGFDPSTGMVKVRLAGSCVGCPSSSVTLRNGVENMLIHYIPEVKGILEVTGEGESKEAEPEAKMTWAPDQVTNSEQISRIRKRKIDKYQSDSEDEEDDHEEEGSHHNNHNNNKEKEGKAAEKR